MADCLPNAQVQNTPETLKENNLELENVPNISIPINNENLEVNKQETIISALENTKKQILEIQRFPIDNWFIEQNIYEQIKNTKQYKTIPTLKKESQYKKNQNNVYTVAILNTNLGLVTDKKNNSYLHWQLTDLNGIDTNIFIAKNLQNQLKFGIWTILFFPNF